MSDDTDNNDNRHGGDGSPPDPSLPPWTRDLLAIRYDLDGVLVVHPRTNARFRLAEGDLPDTTRFVTEEEWDDAIADVGAIAVTTNVPMGSPRINVRPDRASVELGCFQATGNYARASLRRADGTGMGYRYGEPFRIGEEFLHIRFEHGETLVLLDSNHGFYDPAERRISSLETHLGHTRHYMGALRSEIREVRCASLDRAEVLQLLTRTGSLNPGPIIINGEVWP